MYLIDTLMEFGICNKLNYVCFEWRGIQETDDLLLIDCLILKPSWSTRVLVVTNPKFIFVSL